MFQIHSLYEAWCAPFPVSPATSGNHTETILETLSTCYLFQNKHWYVQDCYSLNSWNLVQFELQVSLVNHVTWEHS